MREPNTRLRPPRERFELSLDGRQVASAVVGALVLLAVAFVLGLVVGKQIASRHAERTPAGDLEALDRAPAQPPVKDESLTFHDRLTKDAPAQLPPVPAQAKGERGSREAESKGGASSPPPLTSPKVSAAPTPGPPPSPTASSPASSAPTGSSTATPNATPNAAPRARAVPTKPWTVQLAAAQDRAEAERIAGKFSGLNARVEEAEVPGKGRFYRVRVGGFDTRESAERYLRDVARETGAKGFVTATR
jgi:DedD protein